MNIELPDFSLVVLVGASGAGKSTFARKHFRPTEVLSSDTFRGLVADNENDQSASGDAFDALHYIARKRLSRRRLTVIDATNVQRQDRAALIDIARTYHALPVAIVLNLPVRAMYERNQLRDDRNFGIRVIQRHATALRRSLRGLKREGFRRVYTLRSAEEVAAASITRHPLWNDRRALSGPFDIIGDVHGCGDELEALLDTLGYTWQSAGDDALYPRTYSHPAGRRALFVGDLVDRGPRAIDVVGLVMNMVAAGNALCVAGNHDAKLARWLAGRKVTVNHGLEATLAQLEALPEARQASASAALRDFLDKLISHYVLDGGRLVLAHAGLPESMHGRASGAVRSFAMYGDTTGEVDEYGLPVRRNWAAGYRGEAMVVYGHTPVPRAEWLNNTMNIDTGCVFGGALTALRYPERELVSIPAARTYAESARPFPPPALTSKSAQQLADDDLTLDNLIGKQFVDTRLRPRITIRAANSAAALEVMSRFAVDPRWLLYLPPTMAPVDVSRDESFLERPEEAFAAYQATGISEVVCEEKHMGSRAIVIVGRSAAAIERRFGVRSSAGGIVYTRTGRRFFPNPAHEAALLADCRAALTRSGLWQALDTDWVCLDCELMPWSAKAQDLLTQQYAPVGAAATIAFSAAMVSLQTAANNGRDVADLIERLDDRQRRVARYRAAYRPYCWPVADPADLRLAPFHVLASEGAAHVDKTHAWHLSQIERIVAAAERPTLVLTQHRTVQLGESAAAQASQAEAIAWWESLTAAGGEGMVVKPATFIAMGPDGVVQPALKVRGREYLRLIYGPEYDEPAQLKRLRRRRVGRKRSMALREFALGVEGLERFVRRAPLREIHACIFGVLALESEPVDPRL